MKNISALSIFSALSIVALINLTLGCHTPSRRVPPPADEVINGVRKPAAPTVELINFPKYVREDACYPDATKQLFHWSEKTPEWRFKLPSTGYSHAGFRFLYPHNLKSGLNEYELVFKIKPAFMARHLWVGLIDGNDIAPNVITDLSVFNYVGKAEANETIEVRIPIRDFPSTGHPVQFSDEITDNNEAPFDWQDVLGIRFIHNGGRIPSREVLITHIRFTR